MAAAFEPFDLRAMRHKIETVENTAETLAGSDAIQVLEGSGQIMRDELERNLDRPDGGARPYVPIRRRVMLTGQIELAGAATAGDASPHSDFLRNLGHTSVLGETPDNEELTPLLRGFPSATVHFFHAGEVLRSRGARGRLTTIEAAVNDYCKAGFEMMGLVDGYAEEAVPNDSLTAFQDPVPLIEDNLSFLLDGVAMEGVSLSLDTGVNLMLAYSSESTRSRHTARAVTGTLRVYRPLIATADIRAMASGTATVPLIVDVVTGQAAKDLSIESGQVQIGEPQNVDIDGLRGWDIPVRLLPSPDYILRFGPRS